MAVSGFTFVHNAIESGYPIIESIWAVWPYVDEMVVVDCESTDETRQVLQRLGVRIIDGKWGSEAGETLKAAHALHRECEEDIIIHFEADEVYDEKLIQEIRLAVDRSPNKNVSVRRLQLEQNFQRCRWYPELVHRVFEKGNVIKDGHSTNYSLDDTLFIDTGYLWDITNCFRDNWLARIQNQAKLWHNEQVEYRRVPHHFMLGTTTMDVEKFLEMGHWTRTDTPFNIPEILRPLLGVTDYRQSERYKRLTG